MALPSRPDIGFARFRRNDLIRLPMPEPRQLPRVRVHDDHDAAIRLLPLDLDLLFRAVATRISLDAESPEIWCAVSAYRFARD